MTLTDWIDGKKHPMKNRPGVYQRKYPYAEVYCLWDGRQWHSCMPSAEEAMRRSQLSAYKSLPWRGVAK